MMRVRLLEREPAMGVEPPLPLLPIPPYSHLSPVFAQMAPCQRPSLTTHPDLNSIPPPLAHTGFACVGLPSPVLQAPILHFQVLCSPSTVFVSQPLSSFTHYTLYHVYSHLPDSCSPLERKLLEGRRVYLFCSLVVFPAPRTVPGTSYVLNK